ncbi:MAG TPA: acyl carrier protein [Rhodoblastus sp.]|nr:acyl carrier protein [Rhodoblastus sp.]
MTSVPNDQQTMIDQILDVIAAEGMVPREKLQDDATIESLGLKSIDLVMILTAIEEKFDVYIPMDGSFQEAKDLKGLVEAISTHILKEKAAK